MPHKKADAKWDETTLEIFLTQCKSYIHLNFAIQYSRSHFVFKPLDYFYLHISLIFVVCPLKIINIYKGPPLPSSSTSLSLSPLELHSPSPIDVTTVDGGAGGGDRCSSKAWIDATAVD